MENFFNQNSNDVLKSLKTSASGLSQEEASKRLEENGKNKLAEGKKKSNFQKFMSQFKDIMIIILIISSVISVVMSFFEHDSSSLIEGIIIMVIVLLNAIMGYVQENKAENALESLKKSTEPYCNVVRQGEVVSIKTEDLVVGDIVILEAGNIVPADLRLIETHSVKTDESSLTGESLSVEKDANCVLPNNTSLSERKNMAYSGTIVTYGRATGVVVATGTNTEFGKISLMLASEDKVLTPLQKTLAKIGKIITYAVIIIAVIIFVIKFIHNPAAPIDAFLVAVALAVAAIPESLPAVVTIIMALSVQTLANKNAIIKHLHAVETLGSCSVICSDKTGTLTQNKMTVKEFYLSKTSYTNKQTLNLEDCCNKNAINCLVLCNDTKIEKKMLIGDPTETALVSYAADKGLNPNKIMKTCVRVDEVPFDSNRKMMTTFNKVDNKIIEYTKGALQSVLDVCTHICINNKIVKLNENIIEEINLSHEKMADKALRVLALAYKEFDTINDKTQKEKGMVFLGLVGMIDPPRPEAEQAIKKCFKAGLKPIMITGDNANTAFAIAKELGIASKKTQVATGKDLDSWTEKEFMKNISKITVYARVSPEHKVKIVKAFKSLGKIVAMTGDGVNDAPSLKQADIGVGMGITGTDVTKEVADMIVTDDNFATIIVAVEEGRKIYTNIQKTVQFLLSTNVVEVLALLIASVFMPSLTFLTSAQILFINFVTDSLPAISLGLEGAEKDIMERPPRENNNNLFSDGVGYRVFYQGFLQTVIIMLVFALSYHYYEASLGSLQANAIASTMTFITLNLVQIFHSLNLKTNHSIFKYNLFKNKMFNISFFTGLILVALVVFVPAIGSIFGLASLNITQILICLGCALLIIPLVELGKLIEDFVKPKRIR